MQAKLFFCFQTNTKMSACEKSAKNVNKAVNGESSTIFHYAIVPCLLRIKPELFFSRTQD